MAYSTKAKALRRCKQFKVNGAPCRAFAAWGDTLGLCGGHGGRREGDNKCRCAAYAWPHRPGGGLCRWPDPPAQSCSTPAGTHSSDRKPSPPRIIRDVMRVRGLKFPRGRPAMLAAAWGPDGLQFRKGTYETGKKSENSGLRRGKR
jgi:hypothetical protein